MLYVHWSVRADGVLVCYICIRLWCQIDPFSSSDSCGWYHTLVLTGDSSYISGNISSPFKCKEPFCDSTSFGIIPTCSSVKKCCVLFSKPLVYFLPYEREQEVHKIHPKHSELAALKVVISWQKKLLKYFCRHYGTFGKR